MEYRKKLCFEFMFLLNKWFLQMFQCKINIFKLLFR